MEGKPKANCFTLEVRARAVGMAQYHLKDHPSDTNPPKD